MVCVNGNFNRTLILIPMMLRFYFLSLEGKCVSFFLWEEEKSFLSFHDDVHALLLSRVVYFFLSQSVLLCATFVSQAVALWC